MKKYFTPKNLIFALEIVAVIYASLGVIPREAALLLVGILVFFVIFSSLQDALWLVVASIPLYLALPISDSFDTMAGWRILIVVLFFALFFKKGISLNLIRDAAGRIRIKENLQHYGVEYFILVLLAVSSASVFVADYKILALKKLIFLVNIFVLFLITRNLARNKESIINVWRAAAAGGAAVIAAAAVQFFSVLFTPLFSFWQFWSDSVIRLFYGQSLAHLLSYSNTWFSYYSSNPPTLRLFSLFPDSHSFAMFCILMIPVFLVLALIFEKERSRKIFYLIMTVLALGCIVLSGSRGAWLSVVPAALVVLYLYFQKIEKVLVKKIFSWLLVFVFLFVASAGYPPLLYKFQSWQGSNASTTFSFFERAKSISDLEDVSNKGRLEIWRASLKSVQIHPVLGLGLGNYFQVLKESASVAKKGASAHNLYLDFASETGVFGLLALVAVFANILYTSWLVFWRAKDIQFKFYGLLVGLCFLWVAGYSFFDVVLLNDKVFLLLMVVLASLYNIRNIEMNPEKI